MGTDDTSADKLALEGGTPVRDTLLPYGRQTIDQDDIQAVLTVLQSPFLTTGPEVSAFEQDVLSYTGSTYAVAVANGTAALHAACHALDLKPGDEVIVPAMTFVATANAAVFQGAIPVIVDVLDDSLLIDPEAVQKAITEKTAAVIAVDYAGQPADYPALRDVLNGTGIVLVADGCHSIGAQRDGINVGKLADLTCLSFHPVKTITTGEGGMIMTDNEEYSERMRRFRNHGINRDSQTRSDAGDWFYEMVDLGYNYRITDLQCALGRSQLKHLDEWLKRRRAIASRYDEAFAKLEGIESIRIDPGTISARHIYPIRVKPDVLHQGRGEVFRALRAENIGVNVHYLPVHLHRFYREHFSTWIGMCPVAEQAYEELITLPLFPAMSDADVESVITAIHKVVSH